MSELTLYIRRTKGGHVMPAVSRDELLALIESGAVAGDDELKVVGTRTFPSDETWAPVRDYPEVSRFFGVTGRAQVKVEVKKAQQSWRYAAGAILVCLLAAIFFWRNPYVDAKDAAGEVVRLGAQGEAFKKDSAEREERLGQAVTTGHLKNMALDEQLRKLREELGEKQAKLDETLRNAEVEAATASRFEDSNKTLRTEVSRLTTRVKQLNELPKFWPGAEAFEVPASADDVRLISTLPNNGYLYVIGTKSYPNGTALELNQAGISGIRVFARVVNSYPHAGGGQGMSLHLPDPQDDDVATIRKLKLGDVLKCSVSGTGK